jgi:hypothetical protein
VTARAMQAIFRWPIQLQPLHPDGCGGLKQLTDLSATLALFVSLLAMAITLFIYADRQRVASVHGVVGGLFIILTPAVFFSCLLGAHRLMKETKAELLARINRLHQRPYAELTEGLAREELDAAAAEEALRLEALHASVQKMPVWPADTRTLAQVGLSVPVPLVLLALQLVAEQWLGR